MYRFQPTPQSHGIITRPSYNKIVAIGPIRPDDECVCLDEVPDASIKKYDGNPNWRLKLEDRVDFVFGDRRETRIYATFSLIGRDGQVLKRERHLVPIKHTEQKEVDKIYKQYLEAKRMVYAGRGEEVPGQEFYD